MIRRSSLPPLRPPGLTANWPRRVQRLAKKHFHVSLILQSFRFSLLFGEGNLAVAEAYRHWTGTSKNGLRLPIERRPVLVRLLRERRLRLKFGFVIHHRLS